MKIRAFLDSPYAQLDSDADNIYKQITQDLETMGDGHHWSHDRPEEPIVIDFSNVEFISDSFISRAFCRLYGVFNADAIDNLILFTGLSDDSYITDKKRVQIAMNAAREYYKDRPSIHRHVANELRKLENYEKIKHRRN